jgi:predicted nucleotidyltransferase
VTRHHGVPASTVEKIATVLARFPEVDRAILFGSRAKGTHRPGSDIDLALVGVRLDWRTIGRIYEALDDLLLPFRFSLVSYGAATDPDVAAHIARVGIPLFERDDDPKRGGITLQGA